MVEEVKKDKNMFSKGRDDEGRTTRCFRTWDRFCDVVRLDSKLTLSLASFKPFMFKSGSASIKFTYGAKIARIQVDQSMWARSSHYLPFRTTTFPQAVGPFPILLQVP